MQLCVTTIIFFTKFKIHFSFFNLSESTSYKSHSVEQLLFPLFNLPKQLNISIVFKVKLRGHWEDPDMYPNKPL